MAANYWILTDYFRQGGRTRTAGLEAQLHVESVERRRRASCQCHISTFNGENGCSGASNPVRERETCCLTVFSRNRDTADALLRFPRALLARTYNYMTYPSFFWLVTDVIPG